VGRGNMFDGGEGLKFGRGLGEVIHVVLQ